MPRNTNINDLLFEVKELPVYVDGTKIPVPGFKAIAGYPEKDRYDNPMVFSVVSEGYHLVPNHQALELGKKLHRRLFPEASEASFAVFNIIAPNTRSFCNIDIIDRHYQTPGSCHQRPPATLRNFPEKPLLAHQTRQLQLV